MSAAILAAAVSAYAQGNGQAGITEATNLITGYFDPGTKLVYAIGAVCGLIGGVKVYNKFSSGDPDTSKTAASWFVTKVYQHINACYTGDVTVLEDELKHLEKNNNIRISILNQYDQTLYDTIYQHDRNGRNFVMEDPLRQTIYVYNSEELEKKGYTFSSLQDSDGQVAYIALLGKLQNEDTVLLRIPTTALKEERSVNLAFLIISGFAALFACLIAGFFIGGKFTRPITEMTQLARAITRLDFSKKYTGTYHDELGELGDSLNKMSAFWQ